VPDRATIGFVRFADKWNQQGDELERARWGETFAVHAEDIGIQHRRLLTLIKTSLV
jgi:hypothetical protein